MKKINLSAEEKIIEDNLHNYERASESKINKIDSILSEAKKNKAISLRITNYDLQRLKAKAQIQGIPYQTLITTVLHKYISNQLYEKDEVIKSINLLKEQTTT